MNGVRLGFGLPVSGPWATAEAMGDFARRAEELAYTSLWTFQRLLVPVGADLGPMYQSVHDPIVSLAYVAGMTSRIRLGLAIVNVPFYAPIVLAKQLTSLDVVSAGRLDAGLGLGWSREEFAAAGVPFERRGARSEEFITCLKAVWDEDPVAFTGEFYTVPPASVAPKPVQRPHPPLLLGGGAEAALRRVGRLGDGWISASRHDLTRLGEAVRTVSDAAVEAGRDPSALRFVVRAPASLEAAHDGGRRQLMTGSADRIRADIEELGRQGATDVFLDPNFDPRVVAADVDPAAGHDRAWALLEALAPATA